MKIKRHRKFQRYLNFYQQQLQFKPPYQILVDGTFANAVLASKVNMKEQFPKYFDGPCKIMTTPCALIETEQLGPVLYGAVQVLKGLQFYKCQHGEKPLQAASCLKSIVSKHKPKLTGGNTDESEDRFVVATQDTNLRSVLRELIGIPLIYLHGNAPTMEKPSDKTVAWSEKKDRKKLEVANYQKEVLQHLKDDLLPESSDSIRKGTKKRKRAGPNPLSCKKKLKKSDTQQNQPDTSGNPDKQPKKRKRVKVKIPKHVKELMSSDKK